jgi:hypothetical protein
LRDGRGDRHARSQSAAGCARNLASIAGSTVTGHRADTPIEAFSAGTTDLDELAIFVVDANRPFSSPASLD